MMGYIYFFFFTGAPGWAGTLEKMMLALGF
jgi:hypothetical protein